MVLRMVDFCKNYTWQALLIGYIVFCLVVTLNAEGKKEGRAKYSRPNNAGNNGWEKPKRRRGQAMLGWALGKRKGSFHPIPIGEFKGWLQQEGSLLQRQEIGRNKQRSAFFDEQRYLWTVHAAWPDREWTLEHARRSSIPQEVLYHLARKRRMKKKKATSSHPPKHRGIRKRRSKLIHKKKAKNWSDLYTT